MISRIKTIPIRYLKCIRIGSIALTLNSSVILYHCRCQMSASHSQLFPFGSFDLDLLMRFDFMLFCVEWCKWINRYFLFCTHIEAAKLNFWFRSIYWIKFISKNWILLWILFPEFSCIQYVRLNGHEHIQPTPHTRSPLKVDLHSQF